MASMIPGAREPHQAGLARPGAMGGSGNGSDICSGDTTMDARTIAEHEKEGGGGINTRRPADKA